MHNRQQQGEKRRTRRAGKKESRQKQGVHGEEAEIRHQTPSGGPVGELGRPSVPPAVALIERSERGAERREHIEFLRARQGKNRTQNEQGERGTEEALRGQCRCGRICGASHSRFLILTLTIVAAASLGGGNTQTDTAFAG